MVNRGALMLRCKPPVVRWINESDPDPSGRPVTLEQANLERTVYLISDAAGDTPDTFRRWLKRHYAALFEAELEGWYTDPALWPRKRTFKLFLEWFEPECHTVVLDTVGGTIIDDDELDDTSEFERRAREIEDDQSRLLSPEELERRVQALLERS